MTTSPMLACVIVLYQPHKYWFRNLATFDTWVDKVYLIDNSPLPLSQATLRNIKINNKTEYIHNSQNEGIAIVLNRACMLALSEGYRYLLTMDQDSRFEGVDTSIRQYIKQLPENIAIVYPKYQFGTQTYKAALTRNNQAVVVMTSGNILCLRACEAVGWFDEKLFIDYVDFDLCIRLHLAGYSLQEYPELVLHHQLGNTRFYNLLGLQFAVTNHNPLRRYYITRNRLYLAHKFRISAPWFGRKDRIVFINDLLKVLFVEQEKCKKLWSILKGYLHYRNGKLGKIA